MHNVMSKIIDSPSYPSLRVERDDCIEDVIRVSYTNRNQQFYDTIERIIRNYNHLRN